jgi:Na+/H+ antiporter NhaA
VTWGIVLAYVIGKPAGILLAAGAARRRAVLALSGRELSGTALAAGIGLTVSLLIASRAFHGELLDEAKLGILATAVLAPVLATVALAPLRRRAGAAAQRRGSGPVLATPCPAR